MSEKETDYFTKYEVPKVCPVCGAKVEINKSNVPYCPNPNCKQKLFHRFMRFFSVLEIKGAGDAFVSNLVSKGCTPSIFLKLCKENNESYLCECAGGINGKKILSNTLKALSKPLTVAEYLALFDYDGFDEKKLKPLNKFPLEKAIELQYSEIMGFEGFAKITTEKLLSFFKECRSELLENKKYFAFSEEIKKAGKLANLTFCFTGKACRPRAELQKIVDDNGGINSDSVSSKLCYLVTDDTESGSAKNMKAKEIGVPVITSEEFLEMVK